MHGGSGVHENVLRMCQKELGQHSSSAARANGIVVITSQYLSANPTRFKRGVLRSGMSPRRVHVEETPFFETKPHSVGFNGKIHIVNLSVSYSR